MRFALFFAFIFLACAAFTLTAASTEGLEGFDLPESLIAERSAESIAKAIHSTIRPHKHRKAIRVALRTCASCKLKDLPEVKEWIINRAATFGVIVEYSGGDPRLVFFDPSGREVETVDIVGMTGEQIESALRKRGVKGIDELTSREQQHTDLQSCLLYTSPSPRDQA
eukprot:TRINITY_DN6341_c0_g3_i2.p1 TRINITY_DN6341_c0_g3~~TRINITY_DN6341_c0_g3_i2.p1  ORF type:complete len:168 (+),score=29.92 TRINITY_DN6341_c0_g3_i2:141-644(+)